MENKSILTNGQNNCETDEIVNIIMRQTTYTRLETISKLNEHNNDIFKILREFMKIQEPIAPKRSTINQTIYKEIRKTLGSVDLDFNANHAQKQLAESSASASASASSNKFQIAR